MVTDDEERDEVNKRSCFATIVDRLGRGKHIYTPRGAYRYNT